jgi:uncharacterized protein (DUF885 family)
MRFAACWATLLFVSFGQSADTPHDRLLQFFETEWQWKLKEFPDAASSLGYKRYNDRWPDLSLAAFDARQSHRREALKQLDTFSIEQLPQQDQLFFRIFKKEYETDIQLQERNGHLVPISHLEGIHDLSGLIDALAFETAKDYEDWLKRMEAFPGYADQTIELLREGMRRGRIQTQATMKRVPGQLKRLLSSEVEANPLYKPFRTFPNLIKPEAQELFKTRAKIAVKDKIIPAYRKLLDFLEKDYVPACYEKVGIYQAKDGEDYYRFMINYHTSTSMSAEEIHQIGQKEVARIRREMEKIIKQVGFKGTFAEFCDVMRTDPKHYFGKNDDILKDTRELCKKVESQLPKLFGKLPKTRYIVEAVPAFMAPDAPTGYYMQPSTDGRRPGTYYINTDKPTTKPKFQLEALSLHEAIPGHHMQIALAYEIEGVPAFRRFSAGYNAFVEGWALYSESLGDELGVYQDPYSKFGQLSYEIWRAVRLVVDTGMHSKKWSRKEAIDFAVANSADSLQEIENEIDRYAAWPGQALGYKIGELKIKELRAKATKQLGPKFDVKSFHDMVLGSGAVPLDLLEINFANWLKEKK